MYITRTSRVQRASTCTSATLELSTKPRLGSVQWPFQGDERGCTSKIYQNISKYGLIWYMMDHDGTCKGICLQNMNRCIWYSISNFRILEFPLTGESDGDALGPLGGPNGNCRCDSLTALGFSGSHGTDRLWGPDHNRNILAIHTHSVYGLHLFTSCREEVSIDYRA